MLCCHGPWYKKGPDDEEATGTIEYARRHGAIGVNIECGQHKSAEAPDIAYRAICNGLRYLGMTDEPKPASPSSPPRLITVTHVFYRDDNGNFPKAWKHLQPVSKGEVMAYYADGRPIAAPDHGFVISLRMTVRW